MKTKYTIARVALMVGLLLLLLATLPLLGCAPETGEAATVTLGKIGPLSGGVAFVGKEALNGMIMAAEQINAAGGFKAAGKKYNIKIESYDDEATPAKAVAGFQRLKQQFDTPAVLVDLSGSTLAMMETNEQAGVLIASTGADPRITEKGNKLVMRVNSPASVSAKVQGEASVKALGKIKMATINDTSDWGKAFNKIYTDTVKAGGIQIVAEEWIDEKTQTDFYPQLTKIKATGPAALFMIAHDDAGALIIKQTRELGMKIPIVLVYGFSSKGIKMAGPENLESCIYAIDVFDQPQNYPAVAKYKEDFKKRFGTDAAIFGTGAYEFVQTMKRAMERAGTVTDAAKIREAWFKVIPLPNDVTVLGTTSVTPGGDAVTTFGMGRWESGKLVEIKLK